MQKPKSLKHRAWLLLKETDLSYQEVANRLGVTSTWVRMFLDEKIKDPSVNTVQRLYETLSGEPLFKD